MSGVRPTHFIKIIFNQKTVPAVPAEPGGVKSFIMTLPFFFITPSSFFILYLYLGERYNAFNDINYLKKEEETWEIKVARRTRRKPQNRQKQKKTKKRIRNKESLTDRSKSRYG